MPRINFADVTESGDLVDVNVQGGPHDGRVVKAPWNFTRIMLSGPMSARWIEPDDVPEEMVPAMYVRTT